VSYISLGNPKDFYENLYISRLPESYQEVARENRVSIELGKSIFKK
jgi:hypothetical protein